MADPKPTPDTPSESRIAQLVAPRLFELGMQTLGDPEPGHVRVRILACGVCSSELHSVQETHPSYPLAMGHEPVGVVESVGAGVHGVSDGARVTGGFGPSFADHVIVDHRSLVPVPDGVNTDDAIGEPLGCVLEGRRRTRVQPGDRVALVGAGYMGSLMLQVLLATGAGHTVVVDPRGDARRTGLALGADEARTPEEAAGSEGAFDVVIEATGTQGGLDLATELVREHGILSIVGYHQGPRRSVDMQAWNWKALDVVNAHVRRRELLNDAIRRGLELMRLGRLQPGRLVTHRFGLGEVAEAFDALASKPEGFIKAVVVTD